MISCYALLAVYLSIAGALDVDNLDHSYAELKQTNSVLGRIKYDDVEDTYAISSSNDFIAYSGAGNTTTVDKCELKGKTYYGAFNRFKAPLK